MDASAWIALGGFGVAFVGLVVAINEARRRSAAEIYRRLNATDKAHADFKVEAAQTFATRPELNAVEQRVITGVRESEARLTNAIAQSEGRLGAGIARLETKIDRVPVRVGE